MRLKTTITAKGDRSRRKVKIQIISEAPGKYESTDVRHRHKLTVDKVHASLTENFHVQDIAIK